jgi:phospholipase C
VTDMSRPSHRMFRPLTALAAALAVFGAALALASAPPAAQAAPEGIHKIEHVVMIMQENRSYDTYFGTYPGGNGIPRGVCVPDPLRGGCDKPFYDGEVKNAGGPHGAGAATADIDGGKMDGFVAQAENAGCAETGGCGKCTSEPTSCGLDVMGYHDARDIPNYWTYAKDFVLQDDMYASAASWSLPEHLYLVSGWSAVCSNAEPENPLTCASSLSPITPAKTWSHPLEPGKTQYPWTDITYALHKAGVSWRYYIHEGSEPDCEDDEAVTCGKVKLEVKTPGIWNPLPDFTDVKAGGQEGNVEPLPKFYTAANQAGTCGLPKVSWIVPSAEVAEHPPSPVAKGQAYVTTLINTIMRSPCWGSTAVFVSWDDWGGFYDHVVPPSVDGNGYGLRVPGLVISPYAKTGYVDHQQLSHDAYLKFIEDDFLSGERLNPSTDGRPDARPDVREESPGLGDLANDFDFDQPPNSPQLLSPHPSPGPASQPPGSAPEAPTLTARAASSITQTSATLNATIDPNGSSVSTCTFEYGTSVFYESSVPCQPEPGSGEVAVAVSASIQGLSPATNYHYRVVAANAIASAQTGDQAFTTLAPVPVITSVSPNAGLQAGGTTVRIEGAFLAGTTAVRFGAAPATSFEVNSDGSLTAVAPSGTGQVDVSATSSGGTSEASSADMFTYVPKGPAPKITAVSPASGPAAGGTSVTVAGGGFTGVTSVRFGASAASFVTQSSTSLTAISPAASAGKVDVTVTTPNGTSSLGSGDRFTYGPPTVVGVSPKSGPTGGGTSVTVSGTGFAPGAGATTFKFGSVLASSVQCSTITTCAVVSPPRKAGAAEVRATVAGQTSLANPPGDTFTFE